MLTQVCRDVRHWPAYVHVAVNISPSELSAKDLATRVLGILADEGIEAARLVIEVTENALVADIAIAKETFCALREAGVVTALDDFGTGYASLEQLHQLNFDRLKIDRGFVRSMLRNTICENVVYAILALAVSLNLNVVAEGIESEEVAAALTAHGCDFGQGFLYSEAVSAAEAKKLLQMDVRW
jgi:EAL domain-containing protein (putative c-di-GMP-specific phosphodiesterase class I)